MLFREQHFCNNLMTRRLFSKELMLLLRKFTLHNERYDAIIDLKRPIATVAGTGVVSRFAVIATIIECLAFSSQTLRAYRCSEVEVRAQRCLALPRPRDGTDTINYTINIHRYRQKNYRAAFQRL